MGIASAGIALDIGRDRGPRSLGTRPRNLTPVQAALPSER